MNIDNKRNVYILLIIENEYFAHTKRHNSYNMIPPGGATFSCMRPLIVVNQVYYEETSVQRQSATTL